MENTNNKRRFNIIDLLISAIILVVIALLAYIFVFGGKSSNTSSNQVKIQYVLEVKEEREELLDNAENNIGMTLVEGTSKYNLGTVVNFDYREAIKETVNLNDGTATASPYPEHVNLMFTVETDAVKDPQTSRYNIGGFEISVGSLVYTRLPNYAGTAYCIDVKEIPTLQPEA